VCETMVCSGWGKEASVVISADGLGHMLGGNVSEPPEERNGTV
jgi:hypothetical protein